MSRAKKTKKKMKRIENSEINIRKNIKKMS